MMIFLGLGTLLSIGILAKHILVDKMKMKMKFVGDYVMLSIFAAVLFVFIYIIMCPWVNSAYLPLTQKKEVTEAFQIVNVDTFNKVKDGNVYIEYMDETNLLTICKEFPEHKLEFQEGSSEMIIFTKVVAEWGKKEKILYFFEPGINEYVKSIRVTVMPTQMKNNKCH